MDNDIHIARLESRYHLPPGDLASRARLDRLLRRTLDDGLAAALARLGVGAEETVCIRDLRMTIAPRLDQGDDAIVGDWSRALSGALARALGESGAVASGGASDVVRYRTPVQVLIDLATAVAQGDRRHAWVWRQLGHARSDGEAPRPEALVAACEARPEAIVPVVASLTSEPATLLLLLTRLAPVDGWPRLAAGAWVAAGGDRDALGVTRPSVDPTDPGDPARRAAISGAHRLVATHGLASMARAWPDRLLATERLRRATAALLLLEADPGAARDARAAAGSALGAHTHDRLEATVAALGAVRTGDAAVSPGRSPSDAADGALRAAPATTATAMPGDRPDHAPVDGGAAAPEDSPSWAAETRTAWGGLLFLVHLLPRTPPVFAGPLLDAMAGSVLARRRSLRWCLHALARTLVPVAADDPAALAFAGLLPGSQSPGSRSPGSQSPGSRSPGDEGPTPAAAERRVLRYWARALTRTLVAVLGDPDRDPSDALRQVCQRMAWLAGDPGWLTVRLPLDSVSLPVRRAGLDLDPDWVPWLGLVIKIDYTAEVRA